MAYSVFSYSSLYSEAGSLNVYSGNSPENTECVTDAVIDILRDFRISAEELENTKAQLKGNYILAQESMSAKMNSIGKNMLLRNAYLTETDVLTGLDSITMDQINDAIDAFFRVDNLSGVYVGPMKDEAAIRQRFIH